MCVCRCLFFFVKGENEIEETNSVLLGGDEKKKNAEVVGKGETRRPVKKKEREKHLMFTIH